MELCVNYTAEVKELFEEGKINFVDYFKLYSINGDLSPIEWCIQNRKLIFHGLVGHGANIASDRFLENRDWDLQKSYYERGKCPHISFHINVEEGDDVRSAEEMLSISKSNIEEIRKRFHQDILLENVPAYIENKTRGILASPEYICQTLEETYTYFLLDIAHAKAAAQTLNIPYLEYIHALPLDKVKEVHLSGCVIDPDDGRIVPNHSEMKEVDFTLLEELLVKCPKLKVLTLEYGPFDIKTGEMISVYDKVNPKMKQDVYENLLKLREVMKKYC